MRVLTTTQPAGQQTTLLQGDKNPLQVQVLDVSVSPVTSSVRVYWDADTTVPLAQQNGSEQAPYASLQTAVNVAGVAPAGGTVVCVANRINLTQTFTYDGAGVNTRLNLVAQDGFDNNTPPTFGDYTLQHHAHVIFQGVKCGVGTCTNTRLWMQNCGSGGLQMSNTSAAIIAAFQGPSAADNSNPWASDITHITDTNLYIFGMRIGGNLVIDGVSTDCSVRHCQFGVGRSERLQPARRHRSDHCRRRAVPERARADFRNPRLCRCRRCVRGRAVHGREAWRSLSCRVGPRGPTVAGVRGARERALLRYKRRRQ